jgi:hypothetical protein
MQFQANAAAARIWPCFNHQHYQFYLAPAFQPLVHTLTLGSCVADVPGYFIHWNQGAWRVPCGAIFDVPCCSILTYFLPSSRIFRKRVHPLAHLACVFTCIRIGFVFSSRHASSSSFLQPRASTWLCFSYCCSPWSKICPSTLGRNSREEAAAAAGTGEAGCKK